MMRPKARGGTLIAALAEYEKTIADKKRREDDSKRATHDLLRAMSVTFKEVRDAEKRELLKKEALARQQSEQNRRRRMRLLTQMRAETAARAARDRMLRPIYKCAEEELGLAELTCADADAALEAAKRRVALAVKRKHDSDNALQAARENFLAAETALKMPVGTFDHTEWVFSFADVHAAMPEDVPFDLHDVMPEILS